MVEEFFDRVQPFSSLVSTTFEQCGSERFPVQPKCHLNNLAYVNAYVKNVVREKHYFFLEKYCRDMTDSKLVGLTPN